MNNVLEMLEASASKYEDRTAFADLHKSVSFGELHRSAMRVACFLIREGLLTPNKQGNCLAFYMEKSVDSIIAMFGGVYCNAFYSYIDIRQSEDRVAHIVTTLEPSIIITDEANKDRLEEIMAKKGVAVCRIILIGELLAAADTTEIDENLLKNAKESFYDRLPLYVNFTSGSTGVPKGVAVSHASVIDFIKVFTRTFGIRHEDVIGNQAPFDFDVSVKDIYSGLYTGAKVCLIPRAYFSNPTLLMDYLTDNKVTTIIWAVTAMCFVSIMNALDYKTPNTIDKIMFSGEVMPVKQLNKWKKYLPNAMYVNLYGPTEITCNCTYHILDRDYPDDAVIPIGKAFDNEKVVLLDENDKEITEEGVQGELCVMGTCLALGYYKDSDKTEESFVNSPLNGLYPERMYRTGDLAKYDKEGNFVYCSRKDHQIKHMGQRIELGDIEVAAISVEEVTRSCCLYDKKRSKIVLFYTGNIGKEELSAAMRDKLPLFMVPGKSVKLDDFPMNKNGKIDRSALSEMLS